MPPSFMINLSNFLEYMQRTWIKHFGDYNVILSGINYTKPPSFQFIFNSSIIYPASLPPCFFSKSSHKPDFSTKTQHENEYQSTDMLLMFLSLLIPTKSLVTYRSISLWSKASTFLQFRNHHTRAENI